MVETKSDLWRSGKEEQKIRPTLTAAEKEEQQKIRPKDPTDVDGCKAPEVGEN